MSVSMYIAVFSDGELVALFGDDADAEIFLSMSKEEYPNSGNKMEYETWECYREDD